jgi:phage portal protein BeeE
MIKRRRRKSIRSSGDVALTPTGIDTWLATPSEAGVYVTERSAMAFECYYAGVYVLASNIAAIPFEVIKTDGPSRTVDPTHPLHQLVFYGPNDEVDAVSFVQTVMWQLCTNGNA